MKKNQIDIITMGCSKNLVDSELLMKQFEANGYHCVHDSKRPQGEIAVINTCGFIESAKEESINTILEFVARKKYGHLNKLFVMGCLSQRYKSELEKEIPEVDKFYGKFNYKQLLTDLGKAEVAACDGVRHLTTPRHYAYLKIAEGCDRHCAYCAIPIITGSHKSRPMDEVLQEVRELVAQGVTEIQVIAQELTYYGVDIDGKRHIAELISRMADVTGVRWIRLHYAYPNDFPMELLDVIRERPNVCKYLDIALQHISNPVLKAMHRHVTKQETIDLITEIRRRVPGIALRTTLMVGFPGETEEDFVKTLELVRKVGYMQLFTFIYSKRTGTKAAEMPDPTPRKEKTDRMSRLLKIQDEIAMGLVKAQVGQTVRVLVESFGRSEGTLSGRLDNNLTVEFTAGPALLGQYAMVRLTGARATVLLGELAD